MRLLSCLLVCLLAASCGGAVSLDTPTDAPAAIASAAAATPLPLPTPAPQCDQLTVLPLALTDITVVTPLGSLNPSGHVFPTSHLYLGTPRAATGTDTRPVPVLSPGSLTITRITTQEYKSAAPPYTDYKVTFSLCAPVTGDLAHLGALSDRLAAELKRASPTCQEYATGGTSARSCAYEAGVAVAPGERIGTTSAKAFSLDFGMYDTRVTNAFVRQDRYYPELLNAICPVDLFAQPQNGQLRGKLGREAQPKPLVRTIEPVCGTVMQDIAGTAQGNWFATGGKLTQDDPHLALVHDNIDPRQPVFSVGTSLPGLGPGSYSYTTRATGLINPDFFQVRADGKTYCFEGLVFGKAASPRVVLTMPNDRELRLEAQGELQCGAGPWTLGPKAVRFER